MAAMAAIDHRESETCRRLFTAPLASALSPVEMLRALSSEPMLFGLLGCWADSLAIIGSRPVSIASSRHDPFALLERQPIVVERPESAGAVGGGWFGYLGYQLGREQHHLGGDPPSRAGALPSFGLAFYDHVLRLDRDRQWWFEALWAEDSHKRFSKCLEHVRSLISAPSRMPGVYSLQPWRPTPSFAAHARAVSACRERIVHGDLYQANLALRLDSRIDGDILDVFCNGFQALEPQKAAFIAAPLGALASFSPELFLRREDRVVRTAPIKGTRALPADESMARGTETLLERSAKDRAENVMIVDLMRNDLGRVCQPGTVSVCELARARRQAGVCNLVSQISGVLSGGVGDGELLRAAFPPGSVTGAPKIAAQRVIAELESSARHVYTGAIGYASPLSGLELSVAIRTLESLGRAVWMGVGGGIVADSDPEAEVLEAQAKAQPVLDAIGAVLLEPRAHRSLGSPRRIADVPAPRPDPQHGVFETMLVLGGKAPHSDAHLSRLAASVRELYGMSLPPELSERIDDAARSHHVGRLRVAVTLSNQALALEITTRAMPERRGLRSVRAKTAVVPGGIGAHKWLDRRLIETLEAVHPRCATLLVDLDGYLLEGTRANVFLLCGRKLLTPPRDGRILPGTARARVMENAMRLGTTVEEVPVHQSMLSGAQEVLLSNALQGVMRVATVDGQPTSPQRAITAALHSSLSGDGRP